MDNENEMKTIVLGASLNESRYSNKAVKLLKHHGHEVIPVGKDKGAIDDITIRSEWPSQEKPDTITLYINPELQKNYYNDILHSGARRIIFNPGTENPELEKLAQEKNIQTEEACTLVLLNTNQF